MALEQDPLVGRRIGDRYELVALVGRGAMADVYRARDRLSHRELAVKLVAGEIVKSSVAAARFQRVVKASSKLEHPSIVRVHAWGIEADHGYIVMDLVAGEDLYERLRTARTLPTREAIGLSLQILEGIEVAHAAGVIHRDLKPENVMIQPDGRVRILDFGIAKLRAQAVGDWDEETIPESLTKTGTAVGTPSYMAPEQVRGGPIDGRADLYAIGVLLYEMLTGRLPFEGRTAVEVVLKQVRDLPVPPRKHAPGLPKELEAIILHALEKEPSSRLPSALVMRHKLEAVLAQLEDDEELDVPTRTAERSAQRQAVDARRTVTRDDLSSGSDDGEAPTLDASWREEEPTVTRVRAAQSEETTNVIDRQEPGRFGPSGTLVVEDRSDDRDASSEDSATQIAPPRLQPGSGSRRRAVFPTSGPVMPREGVRSARAELVPEPGSGSMPSIHAWTNAPPPVAPPRRDSELDDLLRQLPPGGTKPWRLALVAAGVTLVLLALIWTLLT